MIETDGEEEMFVMDAQDNNGNFAVKIPCILNCNLCRADR